MLFDADLPRRQRIPATACKAALELADWPGVVCVGWGTRHTGGRWYRKPCLSVHVVKKIAPDKFGRKKPFPRTLHGHRVDVIEVGKPVLHQVDVSSLLFAADLGERSTVTALVVDGDDVLALTSGHAVLDSNDVTLSDDTTTIHGSVEDGAADGGAVDWACVRFSGDAADVDEEHPIAGSAPPLSMARNAFENESVRQYSARRGGTVDGVIQGVLATPIEIDGKLYSDLMTVRPQGGVPFSVPRDSGSLVFRRSGLAAIGAVVAGPRENDPDAANKISYIYDVGRLPASIRGKFFRLEGQ